MQSWIKSWILLGILLVSPRVAAAPTTADRAAAEALFDQGLVQLEAGNAKDACPKLEESQKLDPGVGTLLYLADCYETLGKTASAWATFKEAAYAAKNAGQTDRQQLAEQHADKLKATLSYLVLEVEAPDTPGLAISRDGEGISRALWASELPVDPGQRKLSATAEGYVSWSGVVNVASGPGVTRFKIPSLTPAPPAAPPTSPIIGQASGQPPPSAAESSGNSVTPSDADSGSSQALWGWIATGVGVVGLGGAGVYSALAISDSNSADEFCRSDDAGKCGPDGVDLGASASDKATMATIFGGAGAALAVTGLMLVFLAPDEESAGLRLGAQIAADSGGLVVSGSW